MIEVKYDTPVEVTEAQLNEMMYKFRGAIAGRKNEMSGKCFIKLWSMPSKARVEEYLRNSKLA